MMKHSRFLALCTFVIFASTGTIPQAQATDEFGSRFWGQSNAGLGDNRDAPQNQIMATDMDTMAAALQNIQPAAGEEEKAETENTPEAASSAEKIMK